MTPMHCYQHLIKAKRIFDDPLQHAALNELERIYDQLHYVAPPKRHILASILRIFERRKNLSSIKGLYLWGGVGRGKSFLMDSFCQCFNTNIVLRLHFHRFMQYVHQQLKQNQGQAAPLTHLAKILAKRYRVICIDEFYVEDISDAMLLAGLLEALFAKNIVLVATSNQAPKMLYHNGLQRTRFLPTIALLEAHCVVLKLDGGHDYRLQQKTKHAHFRYPLNEANQHWLQGHYTGLLKAHNEIARSGSLNVHGRFITVHGYSKETLFIDFHTLCHTHRSQRDYHVMAARFPTILLSGVMQLSDETQDVTRRFIAFIDECYEQNTNLVMLAQVPLNALYQGQRFVLEFARTASRLQQLLRIDDKNASSDF